MSKSDSIWIAFPNGGRIPAKLAGGTEKKVGPHEPVKVPGDYGRSLVDDRFAYEAEEPKKMSTKKGGTRQGDNSAAIADLEGQLADLKVKAAAEADLAEKGKLEAEVAEIENKLEEAKKD
jgi:hypothetical protein